jgi:nucleoid-associated protein YgaU
VELATTLPGGCGRGCGVVARAISPRVVRRLAQALIGLSMLAGPLDAGAARAATAPPPPASSISAAVNSSASTDGTYFRTLDRPAAAPTSSALHGTSSTPSHSPAVDLDRPRPRFLPSPPVPVSSVPPPTTANVVTNATDGEGIDAIYVVRRGDALWDVAARHLGPQASDREIAREWPRWYAANRAVIGSDPNLIRPGEVLTPPGL